MGKLYLVGVSIGNYGDMTYRAVETLKSVDVIAAEDTRKARHLLTHFQIKPEKLIAHHAHNEADSAKGLLTFLNEGNLRPWVPSGETRTCRRWCC